MKFRLRASLFLFLVCLSFAAMAQSGYVEIEKRMTAEQRRATGLDTLSPEQLALLNQLLRESEAASIAQAEEAAKVATIAEAKAEAEAAVSAERRASNTAGRHADAGRLIGFNDEPIRSRLKGEVAGWEPGHVFELENGQQWKVLKGKLTLRKPLQAPDILVVPGIAGRWFLQVHEDMPKARVYRID
jgi:hypothetical protein